MKVLRFFGVLLFCLIMSQSFVYANADNEKPSAKVAVIDIQKVVSASSQVKALKASQEAKNKELVKFIQNAQTDINKQKDDKSKKAAAEKYEKQLKAKKEANLKEYTTKLQEVEKNITAQIGKKATEMGYTLVLPRSSVVYGGDDITAEILKVIK